MIRALVTGCRGQVGAELLRSLAGKVEIVAHDRASLDLARRDAIVARMEEARPHLVVNAGAYTAVDKAETELDAARAVNGIAPGVLGEAAKRCGALLVHFSTDYVFDGEKPTPYVETDATNPINAYGRTKLEGEQAALASGCAPVILRTSWVYGPRGRNFLLTMLRLAATQPELRVVDDQRGAPTTSRQIAEAVSALLLANGPAREVTTDDLDRLRAQSGIYHATAGGATTWCGFAKAIFEERARRLPGTFAAPRVIPIPSSDYPTPARRPANSILSNAKLERAFGVRLGEWRAGLRDALAALEAPGAV